MNDDTQQTYQQKRYEKAYQTDADELGAPDRKISDGQSLRNKRILSLGCGIGNDIWYLSERNQVVGLDYALSGLMVGKRNGLEGVKGDLNHLRALPFENRSFDIVICKDILEHLLEPVEVLREVRRVLKEDGYVILSVPNHFYLPLRLRMLFGNNLLWKSMCSDHTHKYEEWNYMHIRFFTYRGFNRFLKAAGFLPEEWFFDLGTLAHYHNPDRWIEYQEQKQNLSLPLTRRGRFVLNWVKPAWKVFNLLFPCALRSLIVSLAPGLLSAGFYVRARKQPSVKVGGTSPEFPETL